MPGTCAIDGCENPVLARGWCRKHYQRWQNHGDPLHLEPHRGWPKGKPRGTLGTCTVPGCERPYKAKGFCDMHYQRWCKHGDSSVVLPITTESPAYRTIHHRLAKLKTGRCSTPGCNRIDTEMALIRGRGHLRNEAGTQQHLYSDRPEDYIELCARCHNLYDEREGWRLRQH